MRPRPDILQLHADGTLAELGAGDDDTPVVRDVATDVEGCPGGLLAEARACARKRTSPRLPWNSRAARDVAGAMIGGLGLAARTRRMLTRHVAETPYLEDRALIRIVFGGDPDEPVKPVFVGHRAVWAAPHVPAWQTVEESTLGSFREAAADGAGPLGLPFASHQARDWWATATTEAGWPPDERASALERIAETPYLET